MTSAVVRVPLPFIKIGEDSSLNCSILAEDTNFIATLLRFETVEVAGEYIYPSSRPRGPVGNRCLI